MYLSPVTEDLLARIGVEGLGYINARDLPSERIYWELDRKDLLEDSDFIQPLPRTTQVGWMLNSRGMALARQIARQRGLI